MNLSCIIIDDEPDAVALIELLIAQTTNWVVKAKCYDALEALAFLKHNKVDLVFLDINMPNLTGMELAALLPPQTKIVFTTAYSEYAFESYTFQTIDQNKYGPCTPVPVLHQTNQIWNRDSIRLLYQEGIGVLLLFH